MKLEAQFKPQRLEVDSTSPHLGAETGGVKIFGASNYAELPDKPILNGVELQAGENYIFIPSKTSELDNDSGYVTTDEARAVAPVQSVNGQTGNVQISIPNALSDLENDEGFITEEDIPPIPDKTSELDNDSGFITSPNVVYCTCATAKSTAAKVATIVSGTLATLNVGDQAIVKFTNSNTSASPTLKIGNTDAKAIMRYGTTIPSASAETSWNDGSPILFVYDGTYWVMCGFLNSIYYEISEANITNASGSTAGLVTGRRAKKAVEAFAPVQSVNGQTGDVVVTGEVSDVEVNGESVVNEQGVAEITIPPLVTDLGYIDPEPYEEDVYLYFNTLTESGFYKFTFGGDDLTYFVTVQSFSVENSDTTLVNQHYWSDEEGPVAEYIRAFVLEGEEVVDEWQTNYMTLEQGIDAFAPKSHVHYRSTTAAASVWDYCNGSQISFITNSPILYTDTRFPRHAWLIETAATQASPNRRFIKLTDLHDASVIYQRSGAYSNGSITWGDWYKFTGTVFTP